MKKYLVIAATCIVTMAVVNRVDSVKTIVYPS